MAMLNNQRVPPKLNNAGSIWGLRRAEAFLSTARHVLIKEVKKHQVRPCRVQSWKGPAKIWRALIHEKSGLGLLDGYGHKRAPCEHRMHIGSHHQ